VPPQALAMTDAAATLARRALDPARSVVVAACAGSGKTWLLVSRILRLLLAGVAPGEILAITFTRYAAQEMQTRLRAWLQFLATAEAADACEFLRERCVPEDEIPAALERGRGLYEEVLRAQPGLTISTFHSWYLRLLRSAPLGAGALGNLTLNEQTGALIDEAWDLFAEACRQAPDGAAARGLDLLLGEYGREGTQRLLWSFLQHRSDWWAYAGQDEGVVARALADLEKALGVDAHADVVQAAMADATLRAHIGEYCALLGRNTTSDQERAAAVCAVLAQATPHALFGALEATLLTTEGKIRSRKPNKTQSARLGIEGERTLLALHERLAARVLELRQDLVDQRSLRTHAAAFAAGVGLLESYQQLKRDRQIVDFADVEWMAFDLLKQSEQAITLQFKLDSRYRHILLDEFQDTNPLQWLALEAWFEASEQAESSPTVFLVGDPKQAIYRFRRAEAKLFDAARDWLVAHHAACVLSQDESRRCAQAVLDVVNRLFGAEPAYAVDFNRHGAHDRALPGRVEILPLARHDATQDAVSTALRGLRDPLTEPFEEEEDRRRESEAAQLVQQVQEMVAQWEIPAGADAGHRRPVRYADIMILVRRRTHLQIYERALRHAGIPFLTSRRGGLLDALEIQDLIALLEFLVSPFDDLKLAHALRSPVFGCDDDDLLKLARAPGVTWWRRLLDLPDLDASSALGRARALLARWLERADRLPVHDHLDKIYFEGEVEQRYAAAVPAAVRDAVVANLHAFVERALAVDAGRYPSLPRFLDELRDLRGASAEDAPDEGGIDTAGNAIRILTVHGAKGLEAPIVWLLDTASPKRSNDAYAALVDWKPGAERPTAFTLRTRKDELNRRQREQLDEEAHDDAREELNLLYVAMTRARHVLIASGYENRSDAPSWYSRLHSAVAAECGSMNAAPDEAISVGATFAGGIPDSPASMYADTMRWSEVEAIPAVVPAGRRRDVTATRGQRYGVAFHRVMECLAGDPGADAQSIARRFGLNAADAAHCVEQAGVLLASPSLRRFFDAKRFVRAFNELPLVNESGELRRVDRVVEFDDALHVLDYKTGRYERVAGTSLESEYREQVAAYCRSLALAYPGKPVRGALIFACGTLVEVSS